MVTPLEWSNGTLKTKERRNMMTSSQVTNYPGATVGNWMNSVQTTIKTDSTDFQSFMENSSKNIDAKNAPKTEKSDADGKNVKETEKIDNAGKIKNEKVRSDVKTENREPENDDIDAVKEAIDEIRKAIEDMFEVTDEQLNEALENLGLNLMALLNPENAVEIAVEITGQDDVMSLVTDGELYQKVTDLTEKIEMVTRTVTEELNIDSEEFKKAVAELQTQQNEESAVSDEPKAETFASDNKTLIQPEMKNVEKKDEKFSDKISFENERPETAELKNFSVQTKDSGNNEAELDKKEDFSREEKTPEIKETPVSFSQNLLTQTQNALNASKEIETFSTKDAEQIMDQITESIKVSINTENTEINMKLHPESLGNVNIKVTANGEGTLTAQITAQNESVKAVIESQAMVLKENLEAKGITVEAIEVMVGTHEFEENFSDSQKREEEQSARKSSVRRINLGDGEEEELSEEDTLQKEIMEQNGNTIDYTA